MSVPARVAAEAAAADVQLAELAQAAANGTLNIAGPPQPTNPTPPAPAPSESPAPPAQDLPPAPVPTAQPTNNDALLMQMQQTLRSTEGRLAAEVAERQRLAQQIDALQRQPPAPPAPVPLPVTEAERNDFGADTVDFITKLATHIAQQSVAQFGSRLAQLEGRLNQTHQQVQRVAEVEQQTVAERYISALTSAVPDWETINVSDQFMNWLQKVDKASNKAYMELLQAAHEQGNAGTVAYIFNLYKQQNGLLAPAPPAADTPPVPPSAHIDPATLAAPNTTAPAPAPSGQPVQGKVWSMAEVDALYKSFERKEISKTIFEQREQEYFAALREGRVQAQ